MDWIQVLAPLLDFEVGDRFEDLLVNRTGRKVHDFPPSSGKGARSGRKQFFLLATFRRHLFQLNEDTVGIALQSCLGGIASEFQVAYQSHNHFRFSVSCKYIGFKIYKLRRFTGRSFDVYFHLWSNGAPHWEREKRLWEEEERKLWSTVVSKHQKKQTKSASKKKVHFANNLLARSPVSKSRPSEVISALKFGSFKVDILPERHALRPILRSSSISGPDRSNDELFPVETVHVSSEFRRSRFWLESSLSV